MQFKKIFPLLITLTFSVICCGDTGEFYKLKTPFNSSGLKGMAGAIASDSLFHYTPGTVKQGILTSLSLQDYALSEDQSLIVLAESQEKDGKYLNRIIFIDCKNFQFINGFETLADKKIDRVFFFGSNLCCMMQNELRYIKLNNTPVFSEKILTLPAPLSSYMLLADDLYLKCMDKTLLKINSDMDIVSNFKTRDDAGVIFMLPNSDTLVNFTDENIEKLQCTDSGIFKMNFTEHKNIPPPTAILPSGNPENSLFFFSGKNELHILKNMSFSEKADIPDFEQICLRPGKDEIFLLNSKKYIIEILTLPDFVSKKRISHSTMRPKTGRSLKFMIPHTDGVFLITQQGEFVFIKEQKRRFFKEKIQ